HTVPATQAGACAGRRVEAGAIAIMPALRRRRRRTTARCLIYQLARRVPVRGARAPTECTLPQHVVNSRKTVREGPMVTPGVEQTATASSRARHGAHASQRYAKLPTCPSCPGSSPCRFACKCCEL